MRAIRIAPLLADAVDEDHHPARPEWLAALPSLVTGIASYEALTLGAAAESGPARSRVHVRTSVSRSAPVSLHRADSENAAY